LAVITIIIFLALVPLPFTLAFIAAAVLSLIYRALNTPKARETLIKATDLTLTLAIAHFCIFIVNSSLVVVVADGGHDFPIITNGLAAYIVKKALTVLYILSLFLLLARLISGKAFDLPISFKAIERFNKWRTANI